MTGVATGLLASATRAVDRVTGAAPIRSRLDVSARAALTFDDGPDPEFTPAVLDVLAANDASGTFFLVGSRADAHPDLVRRIAAGGHAIGSHGYAHASGGSLGVAALVRDFRRGRAAVEAATGRSDVRLFRPPQGATGVLGASAMHVAGLHPWLWSCDTEDWRTGRTASEIVGAVADVDPGAVVLLHDGMAMVDDGAVR